MGRHQSNIVHLTEEEQLFLKDNLRRGNWSPRIVLRAQILLLSDQAGEALLDYEVAKRLEVSLSCVRYRRKRFIDTGSVEDALFDRIRSGRPTMVDGALDAHMTTIACSEAPEGRARWTLRLIKDRMVALEVVDEISHSTVGRTLKKKKLSHG